MNTAGWMLTENGRQPWIVQGLMKTEDGVSPSVSETEIWISLFVFILLYAALAAVGGRPDGPLRPPGAADEDQDDRAQATTDAAASEERNRADRTLELRTAGVDLLRRLSWD